MKKIRNWFKFRDTQTKNKRNEHVQKSVDKEPLSVSLKENLQHIKTVLGSSSDIVTREFTVGESGEIRVGIIYTDGLTNQDFVQDFILKPLMLDTRKAELSKIITNNKSVLDILRDFVITSCDLDEINNFNDLIKHLLMGDTIILIDGYKQGFNVCTRGWVDRGVTEPSSQTVVRGPKDGFCETLRVNTSLLRRRIRTHNLWIETMEIGSNTMTEVAIAYIKGIANDKIVGEVRNRLERIDIDGILESGYIEELIQDETFTPFPTVFNTERPDTIAAGLLEGRIAILVDGTPFVLLVPALFVHFFQASEDYYQRFHITTLVRLLRYLGFFLALLAPSLYIAVTTFHQEMIPTTLLISIASQREGIPFPAFFEALLMEVTFELLREAGIRLPRAVGSAISIVGALVLGEAAVQAGIVAPAMVIVVSITAISSFAFPQYNMSIAIRMLRFLFMILAAILGLYGIAVGLIGVVIHLCSLRSFGIPYLAPLAPFNRKDQEDTIIRSPHYRMSTRPSLINQNNIYRQQSSSAAKPRPPISKK